MGIAESQLDTWSHQGAITGSRDTYASIRKVLEATSTPYANKDYKIFLQGSYGNDTNIFSESDVDVVIRLDGSACFQSDLSMLPVDQQNLQKASYASASYTLVDFKADVQKVLEKAFSGAITIGDKAIAIKAEGNRRKADVIVCAEFRRYFKFNGILDQSYVEGIYFYDKSGARIVNYPQQHCQHLTVKHQETKTWLKPMVRIMKNMRGKLVSDGTIKAGVAPSYYIEALLYNVPADKFTASYGDTFVNTIKWIQTTDRTRLLCANEQYYLLRDNSKTCWAPADCDAFLEAVVKLWNNW
jgi:hypothetical protein